MKLKEGLTNSTQDFWYDLTDGGYLDPEEMCANSKDAERVIEAIAVIKEFQEACEEQIENFIQ